MAPRHPLVAALSLGLGLLGVALLVPPAREAHDGGDVRAAVPSSVAVGTTVPPPGPEAAAPPGSEVAPSTSATVPSSTSTTVAPAAEAVAPPSEVGLPSDDVGVSPGEAEILPGEVGARSSGRPEDRRPIAVAPAQLTIPVLGVFAAPVVPVGVAPSGELEVPPVAEVGWYRFGPHPGEPGSAVLAGHIAYGGVDGWFSRLAALGVGDELALTHVDGGVSRWRVVSVEQFAKDALPLDRVFAVGGEATLTLITCGGDFNPSLRSYADNLVVFASRLA